MTAPLGDGARRGLKTRAGIIVEVMVKEGAEVKRGDPLFRLDDRSLEATLRVREAALASAQAELEKLKHEPRPEDVPVNQAIVDAAEARTD